MQESIVFMDIGNLNVGRDGWMQSYSLLHTDLREKRGEVSG
jgi:hypothetical protein